MLCSTGRAEPGLLPALWPASDPFHQHSDNVKRLFQGFRRGAAHFPCLPDKIFQIALLVPQYAPEQHRGNADFQTKGFAVSFQKVAYA